MAKRNNRRPGQGRCYTIQELSERRGVHPDTVRHWIRQRRFPGAFRDGNRPNGAWLIPEHEAGIFTAEEQAPRVAQPTALQDFATTVAVDIRSTQVTALERQVALLERHVELQGQIIEDLRSRLDWRQPA
jgi:predicted site-specific integrase-resolvase